MKSFARRQLAELICGVLLAVGSGNSAHALDSRLKPLTSAARPVALSPFTATVRALPLSSIPEKIRTVPVPSAVPTPAPTSAFQFAPSPIIEDVPQAPPQEIVATLDGLAQMVAPIPCALSDPTALKGRSDAIFDASFWRAPSQGDFAAAEESAPSANGLRHHGKSRRVSLRSAYSLVSLAAVAAAGVAVDYFSGTSDKMLTASLAGLAGAAINLDLLGHWTNRQALKESLAGIELPKGVVDQLLQSKDVLSRTASRRELDEALSSIRGLGVENKKVLFRRLYSPPPVNYAITDRQITEITAYYISQEHLALPLTGEKVGRWLIGFPLQTKAPTRAWLQKLLTEHSTLREDAVMAIMTRFIREALLPAGLFIGYSPSSQGRHCVARVVGSDWARSEEGDAVPVYYLNFLINGNYFGEATTTSEYILFNTDHINALPKTEWDQLRKAVNADPAAAEPLVWVSANTLGGRSDPDDFFQNFHEPALSEELAHWDQIQWGHRLADSRSSNSEFPGGELLVEALLKPGTPYRDHWDRATAAERQILLHAFIEIDAKLKALFRSKHPAYVFMEFYMEAMGAAGSVPEGSHYSPARRAGLDMLAEQIFKHGAVPTNAWTAFISDYQRRDDLKGLNARLSLAAKKAHAKYFSTVGAPIRQ